MSTQSMWILWKEYPYVGQDWAYVCHLVSRRSATLCLLASVLFAGTLILNDATSISLVIWVEVMVAMLTRLLFCLCSNSSECSPCHGMVHSW